MTVNKNEINNQNKKGKTKEKSGKHRYLVLMFSLASLMLLTVGSIVTASIFIINRTTREHRTQIIEHIAH